MFRAKIDALRALVPGLDAHTVLEVGCGSGHILEAYQQMGLDAQGVDVSPAAVRICTNKGLRAEHKAVEDEDRTFDLVSSDGMLEHFLHFEPMAQHMMRLSKRHVLVIQPNHDSFMGRLLWFLARSLRGDAIMYEYNYRIEDFIEVFARGGFNAVVNRPVFADVFRILVFETQRRPEPAPE